MVRFLEEHGGEVRLDSPVARIEVGGGIARAVELEDGTRIPVDGVLVSNLDPRVTFLELVGEEELDSGFAHACRRWRYDAMSMFCVYLALDEPVRWKAADWDEGVNECFAVSLCESLDVLDDNASDCRLGSRRGSPGSSPSTPRSSSRASARRGRRPRSASRSRRGTSATAGPRRGRRSRRSTRRRCSTAGARRSSGLGPEQIVGRYVASPLDIERRMPSMRHGDWNHGEMTQDQLGVFRPFHEYPPYRTAFENVYLCGSSTHPGGSIGGACGYNAAGAIAESSGSTPGGEAEAAVG